MKVGLVLAWPYGADSRLLLRSLQSKRSSRYAKIRYLIWTPTDVRHPVAALQRFGLVRTPAPPWVALHRVLIPQRTLGDAAEFLITALGGEDMAYKIAGGSKWWQVRAGDGVEGEWIVMKKDWKEHVKRETEGKKGKDGKQETKKSGGTSMHTDEGTVGEDGGVGQNGECE